ncbi:MAG: ArsR family transcriptional regulator [Actinomycetia bacterium]|nr:ArsR family transcriptional regulator [Actinomycetes bacterium]
MARALWVIRLTVLAAARWGGAVDRGRGMTMAGDATESREAADERTEALIRAFLRDGRLVRLPARSTRRKEVLRYLAMRDFRPGAWYTERQVNDVLRDWCEGAETDYVSVRRYLVDYGILDRDDAGAYWLLGAWLVPAPQ